MDNPLKKKSPMQVKTFVFDLDDCSDADEKVNAFSEMHQVMSIVLDRHNSKLIYRVIYRRN